MKDSLALYLCVCVCVWVRKLRRAVRLHTRVYGTSNKATYTHFIVSNGNGVVTGETVIRLITRYWKQ